MDNCQEKFSRIYDECVDKIYRFVFLKVNSQEIAEDLTSETFLKCWRTFKEKENEIVNPSAFLYQIARNLIVDFYRDKAKTQFILADCDQIDDPVAVNPVEKVLFNSDIAVIKGAIGQLKDDYQNIIIWHYLDDLSVPEIAKITNKAEGTVRVTLHRALKALKTRLNDEVKEA